MFLWRIVYALVVDMPIYHAIAITWSLAKAKVLISPLPESWAKTWTITFRTTQHCRSLIHSALQDGSLKPRFGYNSKMKTFNCPISNKFSKMRTYLTIKF